MKHKNMFLLVLLLALTVTTVLAQTTTLSAGTQIGAVNVTQGTLKHPIYHFQLERNAAGTVNLTGVTFTTTGTYSASHLYKFQLWSNTTDALSSATQIGSDITADLGTGAHPFATFSQALAASSTRYFWITTDVAVNATTDKNIKVSAWTTSNFTVSSGTKSGSAAASGAQTIKAFSSLSTDYFRSIGSNFWATTNIWQSSHDNVHWANATSALSPTVVANAITIRSLNTVDVSVTRSTDQTTIEPGGKIAVYSGYVFTIANGAGTDLTVNGDLSNLGTISIASGALLEVNGVLDTKGNINGDGAFTLNSGAILKLYNADGITASAASGAIQVTGTRTFSTGANYTYQGTSAQATGNGLPASVNNLTLVNPAGLNFTNAVTVNGLFTQLDGETSGITPDTDGYSSPGFKRLEITEDDIVITGFSVNTIIDNALMPLRINRKWTLTGDFTGTKLVTFYWDAADDNSYDWDALNGVPAVYFGSIKYSPDNYDISSDPRWISVMLPDFASGDFYTIGRNDEHTLPIELTSFLASLNAYNKVQVQWITQSENDVSGFRIYRGSSEFVDEATSLNVFIPATNTSSMQMYQFVDTELTEPGTYYYWLENLDLDGGSTMHGYATIHFTTGGPSTPSIPIIAGLSGNYPNPFNPSTTIKYGLTERGAVELSIYNLKGQKVRNLVQEYKDRGTYSIVWNGKDNDSKQMPSGVYLIRLNSGGKVTQRKVVMSK